MKFVSKFDVFVSFRGVDTGRSFVSHLCHSLLKKRFRTFKHEEDDPLGNQPAFPHVLQAIEESKVAVVVISVNYTSSLACLDELVKIIECKEKQSLVVVPIFYQLDPSCFARDAEEYLADELMKRGVRNNKLNYGDKLNNVWRWKAALIELTRTFQNFASRVEEDSDMIDKVMDYISPHLIDIESNKSTTTLGSGSLRKPMTSLAKVLENVRDALKKISKMDDDDNESSESVIVTMSESSGSRQEYASEREHMRLKGSSSATGSKPTESVIPEPRPENFVNQEINATQYESSRLDHCFVGMDRQMKLVKPLLKFDSDDEMPEIGICGEAGVGKTTLTRYIYGEISQKYQDHYFHNLLNDATRSSRSRNSTCLLEQLTRAVMTPISWSLLTRYCDVVKAKFGHRRVLLIVDGVDQMCQLKNIRQISRSFGPGSILILVTQDKALLLQCEVSRLYEVESLKYDEALQLFSQFAFKQTSIPKGFDQLCTRAVLIAGRLPLALRVFGSFLFGKSIKEWEFELLSLEASQANCTAVVSSYIRADFYGRQPTKLDRYVVGEDDEGDGFPSYCFA